MSAIYDEREALAHAIYEHSRLRSAEADGLSLSLDRLGYRRQGPVTDAEVEVAGGALADYHYGTTGTPGGTLFNEMARIVLEAARGVTHD